MVLCVSFYEVFVEVFVEFGFVWIEVMFFQSSVMVALRLDMYG